MTALKSRAVGKKSGPKVLGQQLCPLAASQTGPSSFHWTPDRQPSTAEAAGAEASSQWDGLTGAQKSLAAFAQPAPVSQFSLKT